MKINKINMQFLIYICVFSLLGSRLIVFLGFPSILNFFHFIVLLVIIFLFILKGKVKKNKYTFALLTVAFTVLLSSLFNFIAPFNTVLMLLILLEPFLLVNTYEKWDEIFFLKMENMLVLFSIINFILSYFQFFILKFRDDDVRGIFLKMGSGGHLNGAFSLVMAVYFLYIAFRYKRCLVERISLMILSIMYLIIVLMCDNKQSILAYGLGAVFLSFSNIKNIKIFIKNLIIIALGSFVFYLLLSNILPKALSWLNNMEYVCEGIRLKLSFIETLRNNRSNIFQLFFGFGPGMTLSRVARLLPEYRNLSFLGISYSNITQQFKEFYSTSWLMQASSLWMYYFSFASFFGDLGLIGLWSIVILYKESIKKLCKNQEAKYLIFVVISHGLLFDWLEEPAFMVVYFLIIILIGHEWKITKGRILFKL